MPMNIDDNSASLVILPLLRLAFRPLFLSGTLFSIIAIAWWSYFWLNPFSWQLYVGPIWWHGRHGSRHDCPGDAWTYRKTIETPTTNVNWLYCHHRWRDIKSDFPWMVPRGFQLGDWSCR